MRSAARALAYPASAARRGSVAARSGGRVTASALLTLVVLGAVGYAGFVLFPIWLTSWQVDRVLADGAARSYRVSRQSEPARTDEERELVAEMRRRIAALGVDDPQLAVALEYRPQRAEMRADYRVIIHHPLSIPPSVLAMHRRAAADLARVDWDR